jgi:hypothetical protein
MSGPTGEIVLTDAKVYFAQYDISGDLNKVGIGITPDAVEDTTFGASYHTKKPGLLTTKATMEGYSKFNATANNAIDGRLWNNLSVVDIPFSVAPKTGNAGENGFFFKAMEAQYALGGSIGEMLKFQSSAEATGTGVQLVRGIIMEDGKTSRVAAGNSSAQTLGAVSATQNLYAVLHVFAFVGTDVTFKVRSAVTNFATITDRVTFAVVNAATSQYAVPVVGPITDTFWRVDWTTSAGFTSFSAAVIVGIQ